MLRVGLTGGLASGKSTVAAIFRELGAFHVDADRIAHELLAPGGGAEREVVARFGAEIVGADGAIDRKALAAIVFADPRALARPERARPSQGARGDRAAHRRPRGRRRPPSPVALVDAALLVESGIHRDLDALIVVTCARRRRSPAPSRAEA